MSLRRRVKLSTLFILITIMPCISIFSISEIEPVWDNLLSW